MYEQIGCSNKMNMSVDWSANLLRPIVQHARVKLVKTGQKLIVQL